MHYLNLTRRLIARFSTLTILFLLASSISYAIPLKDRLDLKANQRIVFAGDSISNANKWTHYAIAWLHLTYPELDLRIQQAARGGTSSAGWLGSEYERFAYPLSPDYVFLMLGHNDGSNKAAMKQATESIIDTWIKGTSGATPVLIGAHPTESADGKPAIGNFNDAYEEIALAATPNYLYAKTWHELLDEWTNNSVDLGGSDSVHPGTPGHIAITYAVLKQLDVETLVSEATLDATSNAEVECNGCTISNLLLTATGGTFDRLDERLPWAIDEAGKENAVALIPEIDDWQNYSIKVTGLNAGDYELKCDDVLIATLTAGQLAAGFNMATLTAGPVWEQGQEVLGRIRDMHGIDRSSLGSSPPWKGMRSYTSNATSYYQNGGQRGQQYFDSMAPAVERLVELDNAIHEAATPVTRSYSITRVGSSQNNSNPPLPPSNVRIE